jgi:hypothetical protein
MGAATMGEEKKTVAASSLLTGLVSYYSFESLLADSVGGNTLTNGNGVTQAAGKIGQAANFVAASSQILTSTAAALTLGNSSFSVAGWTKPSNGGTILTTEFAGELGGMRLDLAGGGPSLRGLLYSAAAVLVANVSDPTVLTLDGSTWYFFVLMYNTVGPTFVVKINNGAGTSGVPSGAGGAGSTFSLGGGGGAGAPYIGGLLDEVGIWSRVLTATEQTNLYNAGAGQTWPFTGVP